MIVALPPARTYPSAPLRASSNIFEVLHKHVHRRAWIGVRNLSPAGKPAGIRHGELNIRQKLFRDLAICFPVALELLIPDPCDHSGAVLKCPIGLFKMQ